MTTTPKNQVASQASRSRRGDETGAAASKRAGTGERRRGLSAARPGTDQPLRIEAVVPDARLRGAEGPAADPHEPPADRAAGDGGAHQGAGAPGLWLQSVRGMRRIRKQPGGLFSREWLAREGVRVSMITIQKILNESGGLGTKWTCPGSVPVF